MSNIKNVAIYPFSAESIPVVNYLHKLNPTYKISVLISPNGLGLIGKDASVADNREPMGITVQGNIINVLDQFDVLLITDGNETDDMHKNSYEYMMLAIENKKDIICALTLSDGKLETIQSKCNQFGVNFQYCIDRLETSLGFQKLQSQLRSLYTPSTPIIFVGGLIDNANNYEVLLSMATKLKNQGYKVSAVCEKRECKLYKFHTQPFFLKSKEYSEVEKITKYNQFINYIEQSENPDVILIQIPGGMMKYNNILTNDFGIYAYLISQALQPDYFICCTMYGSFPSEFSSKISDDFSCKFGFEINCIHMSNKMLDYQESLQRKKLCFLQYSHNKVNNAVDACNYEDNIPVFNLLNESDNEKMYQSMVEELNEYQSAYSII